MKMSDLVRKLGNYRPGLARDPRLGPDEVEDKPLHSLRRQRQRQLNEIERRMLKEQIAARIKEKELEGFYGRTPGPVRGGTGMLKREPKKVMFGGRSRI